jgi:hypothetical protein
MLWMAWAIPLMVLGVAVAVVPVALGIAVHERIEKDERAARAAGPRLGLLPTDAPVHVDCELCGVDLYAASEDELTGRVSRHQWRIHAIRPADPVLEPALAN